MKTICMNLPGACAKAARLVAMLVAPLAALCTATLIHAASGDLDPAFGVNGIATFSMGRAQHTPTAVLGQADGKYYVSFEASVANGGGAAAGTPAGEAAFGGGIARFNANHTLDTSWGYQGVAGRGQSVRGIVQSAGKLFAVETGRLSINIATLHGLLEYPFVVRYDSNGAVDTTFGPDNGRTAPLRIDNVEGFQQRFNAVAVASDGKLVVVGSEQSNGLVARFNADGTMDTSFTSTTPSPSVGYVRINIGTGAHVINAVAVQSDGKIVVAGSYGAPSRGFVLRLNANGSLDTSFAFSGLFVFSSPAGDSECRSLLLDGAQVLVGCTSSALGGADLVVTRFDATGQYDSNFAAPLVDLGSAQDQLFGMFKHPSGRVMVAGRGTMVGVYAIETDGNLAADFGTAGVYRAPETDPGNGGGIGWNGSEIIVVSRRTAAVNDDVTINALSATGTRNGLHTSTLSFSYGDYIRAKVLPGGQILAAGNMSFGGVGAFRVSRFTGNGQLDLTWGGGGHTSFFTGDDWTWGARDIAIRADGSAWVTGGFGSASNAEQSLGVASVLAAGGLDPAFRPGASAGQAVDVIPNTINASTGRAVRVQSDGRIVIGARYLPSDTSPRQMMAIRFNADGSRDNSFGTSGLALSAFVTGATQSRAMDIDATDRIVLFGDALGAVRITRLTANGSLDATFGVNGMATFSLPAEYSLVFTAAIGFVLPDGKILAVLNANAANAGSDGAVGLMRANANGTLDTSFGNGGFSFVRVAPGVAGGGNAFHAALAPNGRVVVVGYGAQGTERFVPMLARFMPDGQADLSFGDRGVRFYGLPPNSWIQGVTFALDGSMVLTGSTGGGGRVFANLIRTVADGNATGANLVSASSRKRHAGSNDERGIELDRAASAGGTVTTEPRIAGDGHKIVLGFDRAIASVGSVTAADAAGMMLTPVTVNFSGSEISVQLPPMADKSRVRLSANGINGSTSVEVSAGFLIGDVTRSRLVSAADIVSARKRIGLAISQADNAAFDVNLDGQIDARDVAIIRARSASSVP